MKIVNEYVKALKVVLETEGVEVANRCNHEMLNQKRITLEMFQAGARLLAAEILKR